MGFTITNGANTPLNAHSGSVPDVGAAMHDWLQPLSFTLIVKTVVDHQVVETPTVVVFRGVIQPFTDQKLFFKPEGQRSWRWFTLHADPSLSLKLDDVVTYLGVQTRVMSEKDYSLYGYMEYQLVQDWLGP